LGSSRIFLEGLPKRNSRQTERRSGVRPKHGHQTPRSQLKTDLEFRIGVESTSGDARKDRPANRQSPGRLSRVRLFTQSWFLGRAAFCLGRLAGKALQQKTGAARRSLFNECANGCPELRSWSQTDPFLCAALSAYTRVIADVAILPVRRRWNADMAVKLTGSGGGARMGIF
jgi:hypothetical protein